MKYDVAFDYISKYDAEVKVQSTLEGSVLLSYRDRPEVNTGDNPWKTLILTAEDAKELASMLADAAVHSSRITR